MAVLDDIAADADRSSSPCTPVLGRTSRLQPSRVILTEPLPYQQFLSLELDAAAVITDSGGIQEETTVLHVPCFTLRERTPNGRRHSRGRIG